MTEDLVPWLGEEPTPEELKYLEQQNNLRLDIKKLFDEWFYEMEGYCFRSERFWGDFDYAKESGDMKSMVKWLRAAFQIGYDRGCRH